MTNHMFYWFINISTQRAIAVPRNFPPICWNSKGHSCRERISSAIHSESWFLFFLLPQRRSFLALKYAEAFVVRSCCKKLKAFRKRVRLAVRLKRSEACRWWRDSPLTSLSKRVARVCILVLSLIFPTLLCFSPLFLIFIFQHYCILALESAFPFFRWAFQIIDDSRIFTAELRNFLRLIVVSSFESVDSWKFLLSTTRLWVFSAERSPRFGTYESKFRM